MCVYSQQNPAVELYHLGEGFLSRGDLYEAIDHFKDSVSYNPDYSRPLAGLAEAYFKLEEYEQALLYANRARLLARNDFDIAVLEGRIYTGLGMFDDANELFNQLLKEQPYNHEVRFGLAELHVAMGNIENALNSYRRALEADPYNRRGLLSAALLYEAQDNMQSAGEFIRTAVDSYPEDPGVHSIAADFYLKAGNLGQAERHAGQAIALDPDNEDANMVMIELLFSTGRYDDAVDAVDRSIGLDRRNPLLWYLRGLGFWEVRQPGKAFDSFSTALSIRPSDEIARIVLETFLIQEFSSDSGERIEAAQVRFEIGKSYERDNRIELARQEYRRGLMLYPYSLDGRLLYANTFKRTGNHGKYLSILEVLEKEGKTTQSVEDEIEIYRNLREESVSEQWGIEQFSLDRFRYRFALFTQQGASELIHLQADGYLSAYVRSLLQGYESIEIVSGSGVSSFAEAFRASREAKADFFLIVSYTEGERSFALQLDVYNAVTGVLMRSFGTTRTGNNRVTQSLVRAVDSVHKTLPLRGTIYRRQGPEVLVDMGRLQGIAPDQKLLVIRGEDVEQGNESFSLLYSETDLLGEITVSSVDDLLSSGLVRTYQFFDLINPGDTVIPMPTEEEGGSPEDEGAEKDVESSTLKTEKPGNIYRSIIGID